MGQGQGSLERRVGADGEPIDGDMAGLRRDALARIDDLQRRLAWVEGQMAMNDMRVTRYESAATRMEAVVDRVLRRHLPRTG
jgi:hypothetical protein